MCYPSALCRLVCEPDGSCHCQLPLDPRFSDACIPRQVATSKLPLFERAPQHCGGCRACTGAIAQRELARRHPARNSATRERAEPHTGIAEHAAGGGGPPYATREGLPIPYANECAQPSTPRRGYARSPPDLGNRPRANFIASYPVRRKDALVRNPEIIRCSRSVEPANSGRF